MEAIDSTASSDEPADSNPSLQSCCSITSSPLPSPVTRLWRPAAQRNLRNQWSKMASFRQQWVSSSSSGRSHATSLVNAYLSQTYIPSMELGVLTDMPDIRKKASWKLFKQQDLCRRKLLSSYKDMVTAVTNMVDASKSMRCFLKGTSNSPLLQFSNDSKANNDTGDGGGVPVFTFWSISYFEILAAELLQMFELELSLKRLLMVELLSISCEVPQVNALCWSDELYPGEFDDLSICNLYSEETFGPVPPSFKGDKSGTFVDRANHMPNPEVLQVYLTTWLAEVNVNIHRVDEIFAIIGEEMHISHS